MGILVLPLLRCFEISGRSRPAEFWVFCVFNFLIIAALALNDIQLGTYSSPIKTMWLIPIYVFIVLIPMLTCAIRRLHDLDASGWLIFLSLIPVINLGFLLVLIFKSGTKGSNPYGSIPKRRRKNR